MEYIIKFSTYSEKHERSHIDLLLTRDQEKAIYKNGNDRKLRKFIHAYSGKKNVSSEEAMQIFSELGIVLNNSDVFLLVENHSLAQRIVQSTFYNYLYDLEKSERDIPLEEKKYPELTEEYISNIQPKDIVGIILEKYEYDKQIDFMTHGKLQAEYILEYSNYLDLDKLFLLIMIRYVKVLENIESNLTVKDTEYIEGIEPQKNGSRILASSTDNFYNISKNFKTVLEKLLKSANIPSNLTIKLDEESGTEYSIDFIRKSMSKFCGDIYLTPVVCEFLKSQLYESDSDNILENEELLIRITFEPSELEILTLTSIKDLKAFQNANLIDKDYIYNLLKKLQEGKIPQLREILEKKGWNQYNIDSCVKSRELPNTLDFLNNVLGEKIISLDDLKQYFLDGIVPIEASLNYNQDEFKAIISEEELIECYKKYVAEKMNLQQDSTEEEIKKVQDLEQRKNNYLKLYTKFKLPELIAGDTENDEEINEYLNQQSIVENAYLSYVESGLSDEEIENSFSKVMKEMLKDELITYNALHDTSFLDLYITEFMKKDEISLGEATKIRNELGTEQLAQVIQSIIEYDKLDDNHKFTLIMDMFFRNSDKKVRNELLKKFKFVSHQGIQTVDVFEENSEIDSQTTRNTGKENLDISKKAYSQHHYTDGTKWAFYHALDSEIQAKKYANGYVEFYSPRLNKHFIEKFYEVDSESYKITGLAYGCATYTINDQNYQRNRENLVDYDFSVNGEYLDTINVSNMRTLIPKTDRVIHITQSTNNNWMRLILRKVNINLGNDSRYTEEELEILNMVVTALENEHEIMEIG
jgi:hypothetical protein